MLVGGIVWFGLYLALVLTPLALAFATDSVAAARPFSIEVGAAVGFIAFALIVVEFGLVARLRAASAPFGTDALMQFHRQMGIAAMLFVVAHLLLVAPGSTLGMLDPFTGTAAQRSGAGSAWLLVVIVGSSLARRRLHIPYEAWQLLHRVFAVLAVAAAAA